MKLKFNSLAQIHAALAAGHRVYWGNTSYEVKRIPYDTRLNQATLQDGWLLDCRCISNGFGSLLAESEVGACFALPGGSHE